GAVTNAGELSWSAGSLSLSANFYNQASGVFNIEWDGGFFGGNNAVFYNFGQIKKFGTTGQAQFYPRFDNDGSVEVVNGELVFEGSGVAMQLAGLFTADAGAEILVNGNATLAGTYSATGGGTIDLEGGNLNLTAAAAFTGPGTNIMTGGS